MLPFPLIGQPTHQPALSKLGPDRDLDLLVIYHGDLSLRKFLARILKAAGYDEPGNQLHLLEWPAGEPLDLTGLLRELGANKVILFGYDLRPLGLHVEVANYFPITLAGVTYLTADSLEYISQTKDAGDNRAAGALWAAVKVDFMR
jgi:hypothetical protein